MSLITCQIFFSLRNYILLPFSSIESIYRFQYTSHEKKGIPKLRFQKKCIIWTVLKGLKTINFYTYHLKSCLNRTKLTMQYTYSWKKKRCASIEITVICISKIWKKDATIILVEGKSVKSDKSFRNYTLFTFKKK